jgi:NitT/TauT family transport system substrate-binding protein
MQRFFVALAACLANVFLLAAPAQAEKLRIALQKTGTLGWELAVAKAFGLDTEAKLDIDATELASTDAGKIAIQGGGATSSSPIGYGRRQRAQGAKLTFYPHSSAIGAVMTKNPAIKSVKDLAGKTLGVAGGPLDKSWLMLKAYALKDGVDLDKTATVLYGAPPLIAEKALQGEIDAALEFWNFAADLEAQGFARRQLTDVEKAPPPGDVVVTGVSDEGFAAKNRDAGAVLLDDRKPGPLRHRQGLGRDHRSASAQGRQNSRHLPQALCRRAPKRSVAQEEADARTLYGALAALAAKTCRPRATLDPGTFYKDARQAALIRFISLAALLLLANRRVSSDRADFRTGGRFREVYEEASPAGCSQSHDHAGAVVAAFALASEFRRGDRLCHGSQQARRPAARSWLVTLLICRLWSSSCSLMSGPASRSRRDRAVAPSPTPSSSCAKAHALDPHLRTWRGLCFSPPRGQASHPAQLAPIFGGTRSAHRSSGRFVPSWSCWRPTASVLKSTWPFSS